MVSLPAWLAMLPFEAQAHVTIDMLPPSSWQLGWNDQGRKTLL